MASPRFTMMEGKPRLVIVAVWIILLVVAATQLVGFAASRELLLPAAPILPLIPIVGLAWLKPKEELAGWAAFTVWLGTTYLASGAVHEFAGAISILALAALGYFRSPWFIAAAWFAHIGWDFLPRELPPLMADLPMACLIFDGLIGLYLAWRCQSGHWVNPNPLPTQA